MRISPAVRKKARRLWRGDSVSRRALLKNVYPPGADPKRRTGGSRSSHGPGSLVTGGGSLGVRVLSARQPGIFAIPGIAPGV